MYAVMKTGGKQYRVQPGQLLKVELLPVQAGENVEFDNVLLIANGDKIQVGASALSQAKVIAEVVSHGKHKKICVIKFKRRKNYLRTQGHRQNYTQVKIIDIQQ